MREPISLIEPLTPPVGNRKLEDLASELIAAAAALNQTVPPIVRQELGKLVRSMNCYYSNLIEEYSCYLQFSNGKNLIINYQLSIINYQLSIINSIYHSSSTTGSNSSSSQLSFIGCTTLEIASLTKALTNSSLRVS